MGLVAVYGGPTLDKYYCVVTIGEDDLCRWHKIPHLWRLGTKKQYYSVIFSITAVMCNLVHHKLIVYSYPCRLPQAVFCNASKRLRTDSCISAVASFNALFAELICVVEVTGSNGNNVKTWCETFGVEDTWTLTARDWTQLVNPELRLEWIVEKGMQVNEKLCGLAKRKCAFWFIMVVACDNPLESRLIVVGICQIW